MKWATLGGPLPTRSTTTVDRRAPVARKHSPPERQPRLTPSWLILVSLGAVLVSLVALVAAPPLLTRQNAELRHELTEVLLPLATRQTQFERVVASEAAAVRGFALTGDPYFSDRFFSVSSYAKQVGTELDSLAARADGDVQAAVDDLLAERARWEEANFGLAPEDFRERLPEHQDRYEAILGAVQDLDTVLDREVAELRQRIEEAGERRTRMTAVLAIFAFFAAAGALWLAYRLRRSGRQLVRRAQEERALRRVAQTMAEAEDLPGALARIVRMVAETAAADGAHIEQVDYEQGEIEVVAVMGAAPHKGERAPYEGSLAEAALTRGEAEQTSTDAMAHDGRPLAGALSGSEGRYLLAVPLLSEGEALGALLLTRTDTPFDDLEVQRARLLADMAALVLRRLRLFAEVQAKEQALAATAAELRTLNETLEERVRERTHQAQELARALTLAEQRERREVAQVLHDDLQQLLYGLQLGLRTLELQAPDLDVAALQDQLRSTHDLVGEAIESTRRLTVDLSPPVLDGDGLVGTFRWLATHVEERFGLAVDLHAEEGLMTPTDDMRVLLFQTVRELLFNIVKHADTDRARVALSEGGGVFHVEVTDEGVGFDASRPPTSSSGTLGGFGLRRARERLSLFGGCIELESAPGAGTRATIAIPVERLRAD